MGASRARALALVGAANDAPAWRTLEYFAVARVLVASALVLAVAAFGPLAER